MSRSNPGQVNPAQRFFTWSGSKGQLEWYDKETKQNVKVDLPFHFLVLDQLATVTGFCEQDASSYWSNEVRSVAKEELHVKTSKGTKEVGFYKDLDVRNRGAKYAKSIYIAYYEGTEMVIGNIKAYGAALTAWIEFCNKHKVENGQVILKGSEEAKKGATTYQVPIFAWDNSDSTDDAKAIELDKELQIYLSQYLSASNISRGVGNTMSDEEWDSLGKNEPNDEDLEDPFLAN